MKRNEIKKSFDEEKLAGHTPYLRRPNRTTRNFGELNEEIVEIPSSVYYQQPEPNDDDDMEYDDVFEDGTQSMMVAWNAVDGVMRRELFAKQGRKPEIDPFKPLLSSSSNGIRI